MIQLLAAAFCLFLFTGCLAQAVTHPLLKDTLIPVADTLPYKVVLELDDNSASFQARQIHFVEKASGDTVNTFDVRGNNPIPLEKVRRLKEEKIPTDFDYYEVPRGVSAELSSSLGSKKVLNRKTGEEVTASVSGFFIRTWVFPPQKSNGRNTFVFYQTVSSGRYIDEKGNEWIGFMGGSTHIISLNLHGRILNTIPTSLFINPQGMGVTEDGAYLGFISGSDENEHDPFFIPWAWHVLDVNKREVICEGEGPATFLSSISGRVVMSGNKLILNKQGCGETILSKGQNEDSARNFVFDFENGLIFVSGCKRDWKSLDSPSLNDIYTPIIWTNEGVVERSFYERKPDRYLRYRDEFEMTTLKDN